MYLLSNKVTTLSATFESTYGALALFFDGTVPKSLDDISFDHASLKDCIHNCKAIAQVGNGSVPHYAIDTEINLAPKSLVTSHPSVQKLNLISDQLIPGIGGKNVPVLTVERVTLDEDGNSNPEILNDNIQIGADSLVNNTVVATGVSGNRFTITLNCGIDDVIEYDFGQVRQIDGLIHYDNSSSRPVINSRYQRLEYYDDNTGEWKLYRPNDQSFGSNISTLSGTDDYAREILANQYLSSSSFLYKITFNIPIVTSKVRIAYVGRDYPSSGVQLPLVQFFTNADVSAEQSQTVDLTWAMIIPLPNSVLKHKGNQFTVLEVGKDGVDNKPLLLAETTIDPSATSRLPTITQCKLNAGLL